MEALKQYIVAEKKVMHFGERQGGNISKHLRTKALQKVYSVPGSKWTRLSHRRLQNWGGVPHPDGMFSEKLSPWLEECCSKVKELGMFGDRRPNHVLINEYIPGQGIMPHEDGPLYSPTVTTISLGSHTLLDFYHPIDEESSDDVSLESRYFQSLLLEPNSLLVLQDDMYKKYLHGIAVGREEDVVSDSIANLRQIANCPNMGEELKRSTRVSLTIRHVPKTIKLKLKFGK